MSKWFAVPALLLALPLSAQWPGDDLIGLQGRVSFPGANLSDAVGAGTPGFGLSVQTELHFERTQSMVCARIAMGADDWRRLGGGNRSVTGYHVGGDALYFLRDDGRDYLNGPYLIGGLEAIAWSVSAGASDTGTSQRVLRAGGSLGFGYRLSRKTDAEVKVFVSQVDPSFKVYAAMACLNYWF